MTPREWDNISLFIDSLDIELSRLPDSFAPDTVFIGGGTPTAIEPDAYKRMLESIRNRIDLSNVVEFTSEANPGTLTSEKLDVMKAGGINRVSIGVQSFNNKALKLLGRVHDAEGAVEGFRMLREAGFDNVNIDLIQSIPGMKPEDVLDDAHKLLELGPEHVSYYNLIYEPGTPMTRDRDAGKIAPPGDDEEADNYYAVKELFEDAGYAHYEISNFTKEGKECRHNVLYWQGGEYFGCGPSAHSHWNGKRFGNLPDLKTYCERIQEGQPPFDDIEELQPEDKARETLVMWLRMTDGVHLPSFSEQTGQDIHELCGDALKTFIEEGLLIRAGDRLALAPGALFISNGILSELV
jgi:oxygen-independent coproporphyrinogen-3 oxidase